LKSGSTAGRYVVPTEVTLTAHPGPGYRFDRWEEAGTGGTIMTPQIVVQMDDPDNSKTLYVYYKPIEEWVNPNGYEPNYIVTTVNTDIDDHLPNIVSKKYSDGLGRQIQKQVRLNGRPVIDEETGLPEEGEDERRSLVTATHRDDIGRTTKVTKPFVINDELTFMRGDLTAGDGAANAYYDGTNDPDGHPKPDAEGYAFDSTDYYPDPLERHRTIGAAGLPFSPDEMNGHPVKKWYFGVPGDNSVGTLAGWFDADGFILGTKFGTATWASDLRTLLESVDNANKRFFLLVTMDPNGTVSQEMRDKADNLVKTWADADDGNGPIVAWNEYDGLGQITVEHPPAADVQEVSYVYNKLGELITKSSPDEGTQSYTYDRLGRKATFSNGNLDEMYGAANDPRIEYNYDFAGRDSVVQLYDGTDRNVRVRSIYDDPTRAAAYLEGSAIPDEILIDGTVTNTRGRLVAALCYAEGSMCRSMAEERGCRNKVVEVVSYDHEGRVDKRFISIPGLPLQDIRYTYDLQGKLLTEVCTDATGVVTRTEYVYTTDGAVEEIKRNGRRFVTYAYNERGLMVSKSYWNSDGSASHDVNYAYNIRDWQTVIDGGVFKEEMRYEDIEDDPDYDPTYNTNQYNGNITAIRITQGNPGETHHEMDLWYRYDGVNRLREVWNRAPVHPGKQGDEFDGSYEYDLNGRFVTKREGLDDGGAFNSWGAYQYVTGTNKLKYIENSDRAGTDASPNYVYDALGNVVLDRSKKMSVTYDWRNLPVRFSFFDQIPSDVDTWAEVRDLETESAVTRVARVEMAYTADGDRVLKKVFTRK
jgi:YD repeat-containing protein